MCIYTYINEKKTLISKLSEFCDRNALNKNLIGNFNWLATWLENKLLDVIRRFLYKKKHTDGIMPKGLCSTTEFNFYFFLSYSYSKILLLLQKA